MSEEKKEIKKYYLDEDNGIISVKNEEGYLSLVELSEYNLIAGENKKLKYELKKLAELVDEKNKQIDEKENVPQSVFDDVKARLELCRKKLKKLGAYAGE